MSPTEPYYISFGRYYQTFGQDCATICLELFAKDFLLSASTDPTHISSQQIFPLHLLFMFPDPLLCSFSFAMEHKWKSSTDKLSWVALRRAILYRPTCWWIPQWVGELDYIITDTYTWKSVHQKSNLSAGTPKTSPLPDKVSYHLSAAVFCSL